MQDREWNILNCLTEFQWKMTNTLLYGQCFSTRLPSKTEFRVPFQFHRIPRFFFFEWSISQKILGTSTGGNLEKIRLDLTIPMQYLSVPKIREIFSWRLFMHQPNHLMRIVRGKLFVFSACCGIRTGSKN